MKLLLDKNLPKRLKSDLSAHSVFTVADMNWQGKKIGELLKLLTEAGFEVVITFDQNLQYQQNLKMLNCIILQLHADDNTYISLKDLVPGINALLQTNSAKGAYEIFSPK